MNKAVPLIVLMLTMAACGRASSNEAEASIPTASETALHDTTKGAPAASEDQENVKPRSQYRFEVELGSELNSISVFQEIDYLNNSSEAIKEILLVIDAQRQGADFVLEELAWAGGEMIETYLLSDGLLRFAIPQALAPGEWVTFSLRYQLTLPEQVGALGQSSRQSNFVDWYPFVPPYIGGSGWLLHSAAEVGEYLAYESADFELIILLAEDSGRLQIAAPAPVVENGRTLSYRLERARRFAWSVSEHYELLTGELQGIPIRAYVFPEHLEAGETAIQISMEALEIYQQLFGPYPYESLTLVEAEFPDGLESDGLFFLSEVFFISYGGGNQNYLSTLSAHEVAHNWWFGLVGNNPALEPWLDEALATYSELLYYESAHPELVDWWWKFRVYNKTPTGRVDSSIYEHQAFAPYVNAVYLRGALFFAELRQELGDETFFAFLLEYVQQGEGQLMSDEDFFNLLEGYANLEQREFFDEYFRR